jgi:hypothetical protein
MSDRLTLAHAFEDAGIAREKAEVVATAVLNAIRDNVATKADLEALRTGTKADLAALRAELKEDTRRLEARIDLLAHQLLTRLGGLMVVLASLLFAAMHLWPAR